MKVQEKKKLEKLYPGSVHDIHTYIHTYMYQVPTKKNFELEIYFVLM